MDRKVKVYMTGNQRTGSVAADDIMAYYFKWGREATLAVYPFSHILIDAFENKVKMEDKFYTPAIEDLHVGLICEWTGVSAAFEGNMSDDIRADIADPSELSIILDWLISEDIKNVVRVKYLDRIDVTDLGWSTVEPVSKHTPVHYSLEVNERFYYLFSLGSNRFSLQSGLPENDVLYQGFIYNKSELIKIMKQLNIYRQ